MAPKICEAVAGLFADKETCFLKSGSSNNLVNYSMLRSLFVLCFLNSN